MSSEMFSSAELEQGGISVEDLIELVQSNENEQPFGGSLILTPTKHVGAHPKKLSSGAKLQLVNERSESPSSLQLPQAVPSLASSNEDRDVFIANTENNRKRRRKPNPSVWKRNETKEKRMRGEAYMGYKRKRDPDGIPKFKTGVSRSEKQIGPPCTSKYCQKAGNRNCESFSEENRLSIHTKFWKLLTWDQKKAFVCSLVDCIDVKHSNPNKQATRKETFLYFLKLDERKVQVCRQMLLSTLSLGKWQVMNWVKTSTAGFPLVSPREFKDREPVRGLAHEVALKYLDSLPKLPSHYCRAQTSKIYLEPPINSINELYTLYLDYCKQNSHPSLSRTWFTTIIKEKNIGIFQPRKDQCDMCVAFKEGQLDLANYNDHIRRKTLARNEQVIDENRAKQNEIEVLSVDLQAVKLAPSLKASALYYKTKLCVHNYTVYNGTSKDATCYIWNESEGDLSASVFASCLTDYINNYLPGSIPIVIYSDGCTYQNRNAIMANALLDLSVKSKRAIIQKFLEKGHTQMKCDSVHSAIESELKNKPIYIPFDYVKICQDPRSRHPYLVKYLRYEFFKDFTLKRTQRYHSIRPGEGKGSACVTDLKQIRYSPTGKIYFQLGFDETEWKELKQKCYPVNVNEFPALFSDRLKITCRKYKDLQELKKVVPTEYHQFYNELPFKT